MALIIPVMVLAMVGAILMVDTRCITVRQAYASLDMSVLMLIGGAIMGDDPSRSVLNQFCQSWEVDNLFVTDGACFVSNADKNPTLSIMSIAWRASDYIVEQMSAGSL